jgi:hypothetical protein
LFLDARNESECTSASNLPTKFFDEVFVVCSVTDHTFDIIDRKKTCTLYQSFGIASGLSGINTTLWVNYFPAFPEGAEVHQSKTTGNLDHSKFTSSTDATCASCINVGFIFRNALWDGAMVQYRSGSSIAIGGLTDTFYYYVRRVSATEISLFSTLSEAKMVGSDAGKLSFTSSLPFSGSTHSIVVPRFTAGVISKTHPIGAPASATTIQIHLTTTNLPSAISSNAFDSTSLSVLEDTDEIIVDHSFYSKLVAMTTVVQYHASGRPSVGGLQDKDFYKVKEKNPGNRIKLCLNADYACNAIQISGASNTLNFFTIPDEILDGFMKSADNPGGTLMVRRSLDDAVTMSLESTKFKSATDSIEVLETEISRLFTGVIVKYTAAAGSSAPLGLVNDKEYYIRKSPVENNELYLYNTYTEAMAPASNPFSSGVGQAVNSSDETIVVNADWYAQLVEGSTIVKYYAAGSPQLTGLSDKSLYKIKEKVSGNKIKLCAPSGPCNVIDINNDITNDTNFFAICDGLVQLQNNGSGDGHQLQWDGFIRRSAVGVSLTSGFLHGASETSRGQSVVCGSEKNYDCFDHLEDCTLCEVGKYQSASGQLSCISCAAGRLAGNTANNGPLRHVKVTEGGHSYVSGNIIKVDNSHIPGATSGELAFELAEEDIAAGSIKTGNDILLSRLLTSDASYLSGSNIGVGFVESVPVVSVSGTTTKIVEGATFSQSDTVLTVANAARLNLQGTNQIIRVGSEKMQVTGISANNLTVTRGAMFTLAASHSDGSIVHRHPDGATGDFAELQLMFGNESDRDGFSDCGPICAAGKYVTAIGRTSCVSCPAGTYNSASPGLSSEHDALVDCKVCAVGTYSVSGSGSCIACAAGRSNPETHGAGEGANLTSDTSLNCGSSSNFDCFGDDACAVCPEGRYQPQVSQATCIACNSGKHGPSATASDSGTFDSADGADVDDAENTIKVNAEWYSKLTAASSGSFDAGHNQAVDQDPADETIHVNASWYNTLAVGTTVRYHAAGGSEQLLADQGLYKIKEKVYTQSGETRIVLRTLASNTKVDLTGVDNNSNFFTIETGTTIVKYNAAGGTEIVPLTDQSFYRVMEKIGGNKIKLCAVAGSCDIPLDLQGVTNIVKPFFFSSRRDF